MPAFERVELDRDGVAEVLTSAEFAAAIQTAAEVVAESVRVQGHRVSSGDELPVEVFVDPAPDRAAVTVAIRHPAGVGMQAHHGVLTRAAEAAGIEVAGLDAGSGP